jgi:hypothetical protein
VAPSLPLFAAGLFFVKGYGLLYSERARALLPRVGIAPPAEPR